MDNCPLMVQCLLPACVAVGRCCSLFVWQLHGIQLGDGGRGDSLLVFAVQLSSGKLACLTSASKEKGPSDHELQMHGPKQIFFVSSFKV